MSTQRGYLYGVIPANGPKNYGPIGIGGGEVCAVSQGKIAMIAGPIDGLDLSHLPPEKTLQYLAEHQRVLERVMIDSSVIPLKFGTVAEDDRQIIGILQSGQDELTRVLQRYSGKVELDLAVFWADLQAVLGEIAHQEVVISMKAQIAASGEATIQQRVRLGQLVKGLLDQQREKIAAELVVALQTQWSNMVVNSTNDDSMVLNAAVLIDKTEEAQFDQTIEDLSRRYDNRLHFRCVGPLPPYSFATVEVKVINAGELNAARQVLELGESVSLAEIKAAHRRLLQKYHPDRNSHPDAANLLKKISSAYELLEQYALNFKHRFGEAATGTLTIVKVSSLSQSPSEAGANAA